MLGTQPIAGVVAAGPRGRGALRRPRGRRRRPAVEALESRRLLAVAINEFPLPTTRNGPLAIAAGPDGALWFTVQFGDKIGRITTSGAVVEFPLPTPDSSPEGIAAGLDGNLWFTEEVFIPGWGYQGRIGRITTSGAITEFPLPTPDSHPAGITAGPDGALWFTEPGTGRIGRITTAGVIREFSLPTPDSSPGAIAAGPDGALWFTEQYGGRIGRITTAGVISEFPLPARDQPPQGSITDEPLGIAAGPDGNMWFIDQVDSNLAHELYYSHISIGKITPAGTVTEYETKRDNLYIPYYTFPLAIAAGPDGDMWFAEGYIDAIGRITTSGAITEFPVPTHNSQPVGIASGPDGNLWFTERYGEKIGQAVLSGPDSALRADLAITSSAQPAPATAGRPVAYTLTVANRGPDPALGVTVTDALPAGAAFASAAATQGLPPTRAGGLVTAYLGTLAAGATATVTIVVTPAAAGTLVNAARVATTSYDPDPANDAATASTLVNPPPVLAADLAIALSTSPAVARAGSPLTYTLMVVNRGPGVASGVVVADALPARALVAWATASQGGVPARAGGVLVARLGDLAPGARATVTLVVMTSAAGALDDVAVVASAAVDPAPADNAVARRITVFPPASSYRPAVGTGAIPPPSGPGAGSAARTVTPTAPAPAAGLAGRFGVPLRPATLPPWSAWGRGPRRAGWWGAPW